MKQRENKNNKRNNNLSFAWLRERLDSVRKTRGEAVRAKNLAARKRSMGPGCG